MPNSIVLTNGLPGPGIQVSDHTDLNIVLARGYTERWAIRNIRRINIGMTIQIAANAQLGHQPRGYVINSFVTGIQLCPPQPDDNLPRWRIYFDQNNPGIINTGIPDITFLQDPVRLF